MTGIHLTSSTIIHYPKVIQLASSSIFHDPEVQEKVAKDLKIAGINVVPFEIDVEDYQDFLKRARYEQYQYLDHGKHFNFPEKSLEHYLAAKLLNLNPKDVYLDVANNYSPVPDIYNKIYRCKTFRHDLIFPPGFHGDMIGSDAAKMPVPNGSFSKMALHCSFEMFERDSDIGFISEANRVLCSGGKVCIIPLYFYKRYAIQTSTDVFPPEGLDFDEDADICIVNDLFKTRYARYYDVPTFLKRIWDNLNGMILTVYNIENQKEIDPTCYVKFAVLIEKVGEIPPFLKSQVIASNLIKQILSKLGI